VKKLNNYVYKNTNNNQQKMIETVLICIGSIAMGVILGNEVTFCLHNTYTHGEEPIPVRRRRSYRNGRGHIVVLETIDEEDNDNK
jgi:hypothetical protein